MPGVAVLMSARYGTLLQVFLDPRVVGSCTRELFLAILLGSDAEPGRFASGDAHPLGRWLLGLT